MWHGKQTSLNKIAKSSITLAVSSFSLQYIAKSLLTKAFLLFYEQKITNQVVLMFNHVGYFPDWKSSNQLKHTVKH